MSYPSVDQLQKLLAESVFHYAADKKKAAGRALGTLVEVVTFYLLRSWELQRFIAIERPLPEYSNDEITHYVEYSLHPSTLLATCTLPANKLPLSASKLSKILSEKGVGVSGERRKASQLLSCDLVLRNACTISEGKDSFLVATLASLSSKSGEVAISRLMTRPFAIAECKRVGVEEGTRKGPQTIEKARQGAYVARSVSSLQKIRLPTGEIGGVFVGGDGRLICRKYEDFLQEIIGGDDPEFLRRFILTIGVVSNHGNWFTSDDHNKELKVLAQSYDWLLFLTDSGLAQFIDDLIVRPAKHRRPVRDAFLSSYAGESGVNQFTKVQIAYRAHEVLSEYFAQNAKAIESWFNVITPKKRGVTFLRDELRALAGRDWKEIHK
jgi:hypothetical protein